MQTSTHLALQPTVAARPLTGFEQTLASGALKRVEAKEFVFAEGDAASHVYRVETGAVALFKVLADGRRQIVCFAYPGDLIGLGAEGEHVMNAQAIKPTRLRCLPMSGLHRSVAQDPSLAFKLYQAIAREPGLGARSCAHDWSAQCHRAGGELPTRLLSPERTQRPGSVSI